MPARKSTGVFAQSIAVAGTGFLLAIAANTLSPRGLTLSRDYFPTIPLTSSASSTTTNLQAATQLAPTNSADNLLARLSSKGLRGIETEAAAQLFNSPEMAQGLVMFIDARDQPHYEQGHIPSAHLLDYYRPENYLPDVLPLTQVANRIVVYCNGGNCEDSEFTAVLLKNAGVTDTKLEIYVGGFAEWKAKGLPVELGSRMSGNTTNYPVAQ